MLLLSVLQKDKRILNQLILGFQNISLDELLIESLGQSFALGQEGPSPTIYSFPSHLSPSIFSRSKVPLFTQQPLQQTLHKFSPLSLSCLLGDVPALKNILSSLSTPVSASNLSVVDAMGGVCPLLCCVVTFNPICLLLLREHMGSVEFSKACINQPSQFHDLKTSYICLSPLFLVILVFFA